MNGNLCDYQKLFDSINSMVFIIDCDGVILACNHAVITTLGFSRDELIGSHVLMLHPPDSNEEVCRVIASLSDSSETICILPLVTKCGAFIETETRIYKGTWENEQVLFGFSTDMTKQRAIERKFEAVFLYSPIPILVSKVKDGTIIDCNGAWCNLVGYKRDEVLGKTTLDLDIWKQPEDRQKVIERLNHMLDFGSEPVQFLNKGKEIIYGLLSASQITIDGEALWVTSLVDRTEQYLLERQLDEIRELTLTSALEQLDRKLSTNKYIRFGA